VDNAGGEPGSDSLVNYLDKSRGSALTSSSDTQPRNQRLEDVVSTLLRHRNLFGGAGADGSTPRGMLINQEGVRRVLSEHRSEFTAEEQTALSMFSQEDFYYLMQSAGGYADPGVTDPAEVERALQNGKLSIDWLEQWLFVNNEDPRPVQATAEEYAAIAGGPALNQPDTSYVGMDIYDV
jgi:hypothetical protein